MARHAHDIASRPRRQIAVVKNCGAYPLTLLGVGPGHTPRAGRARGIGPRRRVLRARRQERGRDDREIVLGPARSPAARGATPQASHCRARAHLAGAIASRRAGWVGRRAAWLMPAPLGARAPASDRQHKENQKNMGALELGFTWRIFPVCICLGRPPGFLSGRDLFHGPRSSSQSAALLRLGCGALGEAQVWCARGSPPASATLRTP